MNEQPEAAAKAAEAFRKWCGNSYEWDALTDIERQRWIRFSETEYYRIHSRDEQIAALTDKLTEEHEKACVLQSQVDNADVNLEQVRMTLRAQLATVTAERDELRGKLQDKCEHEWEHIDDSFDHEFGTEQIHCWRCESCGLERPYVPETFGDEAI